MSDNLKAPMSPEEIEDRQVSAREAMPRTIAGAHHHLFNVPVEWMTHPGDVLADGNRLPSLTVVTKLQCQFCTEIEVREDSSIDPEEEQ